MSRRTGRAGRPSVTVDVKPRDDLAAFVHAADAFGVDEVDADPFAALLGVVDDALLDFPERVVRLRRDAVADTEVVTVGATLPRAALVTI